MPTLVQVFAAQGQTVYVLIWNSLGKVWNDTTSAFETYSSANWSQYAITATEQASSGSYFASIPTSLTTPGAYSWAGYAQGGGSPIIGDAPINQGNFQIFPSGALPTVQSGLRSNILIQPVGPTGNTVYAFIWDDSGQIYNATTHLFETYAVGHWSSYVISTTEDSGSGNYFANVPSPITDSGLYTWAAYIVLAASPAASDTGIDDGTFEISATDSTDLADLIISLRTLSQDTLDSKTIWSESLGASDQPAFPVDGVNTTFRLKSAPLSDANGQAAYVWVTIVGHGATVRSQSLFTIVDQINGIISFTTAPDPGNGTYPTTPPTGVYVDYNYQFFSDAKYAEFLDQAANDTLAGTSDPTTMIEGLKEVMLQFALSRFWYARASQYANQYRSSGGDASEDIQTVAQTFINLGKAAQAQARALLTAFYQRQGQRDAPAYADVNHNWDPISPIR